MESFTEYTRLGYLDELNINADHARLHPNNCAIREVTADGNYVGVCWHYLKGGTTCPRHGVVKRKLS